MNDPVNTKKEKAHSRSLESCLVLILSVAAAFFACLILFRLFYQRCLTEIPVFTDLIIEATAESGYNKAGEIRLFDLLAILGLLIITVLSVLLSGKSRKDIKGSFLPILLFIPALIYLAVSGIFSLPLFFLAGFSALMLPLSAHLETDHLTLSLLPALSYYCILACLELITLFTDRVHITDEALYAVSAGLTILALLIIRFAGKKCVKPLLFTLQLPIPLLFTVWLRDRYVFEGSMIRVPYAAGYYVLIYLAMAASYVFLFADPAGLTRRPGNKKEHPGAGKTASLINAVTPIVIFAYRSWQACPVFAQPDQHHHGEQLIPWQQIMTLAQKPYDEYTPVSGMFPMLNGFIQHVFLKGTVSDYAPALSLTTLLFAVVTMALVCAHIKPSKALILAMIFSLPCYNRQYMVLPLLLLFFLPGLVKRRSLWFKLWLLGCFLGGLYYPLFGASVLAGTLPLFLLQLCGFIREKEYRSCKEKPLPYVISWIITLLPIALCLPLLYRMAVHTLIYSSQTVLADGISLAGQSAPESFLGYLEGLSGGTAVRDSIYLIYRFFLPMLWIFIPWAFAVITYCAWRSNASAGKDRPGSSVLPDPLSEKGRLLYALLASVITLFISYSYTLVRADTGVLLARTGPVLAAAAMFFAVSLFADDTLSEAGDEAGNPDDPESIPAAGSHSMTLSSCLLIALCLSVPFMIWARVNDMKNPYLWTYPDGDEKLVFSDTSRLYTYTAVPETFMLLSEVPIRGAASLGNGFMVSDQISYLEQYDRVDKKLKDAGFDDISYMGYDGQGFYYFMNTKACGTGYLPVARSMEAQEEILSRARKERPVIFRLDPKKSFYIYRWVLSKEAGYVYLAQDDCFYPAEVYAALMKNDPLMPKEGDDPGTADQVTDLGRVCESFGNSAASILDNICTDEKGGKATPALPVSSVSFEGRSGELLYISLDLEKIEASAGTSVGALEISFMPKSAASGSAPLIRADAAGGKLLIPAGMNTCWEEGAVTVTGFTFLDENNAPALTISPGELTDYLTDDPRCGYYEICSR